MGWRGRVLGFNGGGLQGSSPGLMMAILKLEASERVNVPGQKGAEMTTSQG